MNKFEKLFAEMIEFMEFSLDRDEDGVCLIDWHVYSGEIGEERFDYAEEIVDRMDAYIKDYMLDDEVWGSFSSVEEAYEKCEKHPLRGYFDLMINHLGEVRLENIV